MEVIAKNGHIRDENVNLEKLCITQFLKMNLLMM